MVSGDVVALCGHVNCAGSLVSWVWGSNFGAGAAHVEVIESGVGVVGFASFFGWAKVAGSVSPCVKYRHPVSDQCVCVIVADIFSDGWAGGCSIECVVV